MYCKYRYIHNSLKSAAERLVLRFWIFTSVFGVEILSNALFLWAESFVLGHNILSIIL